MLMNNNTHKSDYLSGLIDLSKCITGVPDGFHTPTAKLTQRSFFNPVGSTAAQAYVVRPTLENNVGYGNSLTQLSVQDNYRFKDFRYLPSQGTAPGLIDGNSLMTSDDPEMQALIDEERIDTYVAAAVTTAVGGTVNVVTPCMPLVGERYPTRLPFRYFNGPRGFFHQSVVTSGTSRYCGSVLMDVYANTLVSYNVILVPLIQYYTIDKLYLGVSLGTSFTYTIPATSTPTPQLASFEWSMAAAGAIAGAVWCNVGFQLSSSAPQPQFYSLREERSQLVALGAPSPVTFQFGLAPLVENWTSVRDLWTISKDMSKVRVTGQSLLLTYVGAQLEGGLLQAGTILDGTSWGDMDVGLLDTNVAGQTTSGLQAMPNSYSDKLNNGLYAIYRPQNLEMATAWHRVSEEFDFTLPYHLILIRATALSAQHRLEVVTNLEAQTVSPLYTLTVTKPDFLTMIHALDSLPDFPLFSGNPDHIANIKRLLALAYNNRSTLARIAGYVVGQPEVGNLVAGGLALLPDLPKSVKAVKPASRVVAAKPVNSKGKRAPLPPPRRK